MTFAAKVYLEDGFPSYAPPRALGRRPQDDALRLGTPAPVSRSARRQSSAISMSPPTPACSRIVTGSGHRRRIATLIVLHGLEGLERRALHARHRRQSVGARLQCRAAEPAQLRRHRAPLARSLPLGADGGSAVRPARADRSATACRASRLPGYSLGGNLALKLAGESGRRRTAES